jgi:hypothetical protein
VFVFSHAPILGSGLRVLQSLHLRGPNAWLNHCDDPGQFIRLAARRPQIKLWFSAHNHLGQHYPDSVTQVGDCTFVHTGVIGSVSRDGRRHSRLVRHDSGGFELWTLDHATGELEADVRCRYADGQWERLGSMAPADEAQHFAAPRYPHEDRLPRVGQSAFLVHRGMVLEYDAEHRAPLGIVCEAGDGHDLRIDGDCLAVVGPDGTEQLYSRGQFGRFSRVWVPNPWAPG